MYFWPPHSGNPQELLNVQQMRDDKGELVVKKIEPGILTSEVIVYVFVSHVNVTTHHTSIGFRDFNIRRKSFRGQYLSEAIVGLCSSAYS